MSWGVATQNGVSVSLASIVSLSCGATEEFSPASLFTSGVQGAWYDPSDYTTLFQDFAGTTPVTAVEQPVGLMLDKSQNLALGSELVTNGTFDSNITGWSVLNTATIAWDAGRALATATGTFSGIQQTLVSVVGNWYQVTAQVELGTSLEARVYLQNTSGPAISSIVTTAGVKTLTLIGQATTTGIVIRADSNSKTGTFYLDNVSVKLLSGNHALQATAASRPVLRARYNNFVATTALATQNVTTLATTYKLSFTGAGTITLSGTNVGVYSAGTTTITCTAGTLTATVTGTVTNADLRLSSTAASMPSYQLVTTSTNYDTVGFLPYLSLDGVDDSYGTNSINFTATDKMSVVAGVTKLSDAAAAMMCELSTNSQVAAGSFGLWSPVSAASPDYAPYLFGSAGSFYTATSFASPVTNVVSTVFDIAGAARADEIKPRVNGAIPTLAAGGATSAGTGNFGTYPLFIGRRNNASLPFNGRIYQMIVCGKALSASELASTEAYVNARTGAY